MYIYCQEFLQKYALQETPEKKSKKYFSIYAKVFSHDDDIINTSYTRAVRHPDACGMDSASRLGTV